ncbi:hypothetical protein ABEB36_011023 [Hypothenemus hampei]|uniref:Nuclear respiratory factor 1 NLS/DNA-binding dimerisation domain-containing protein n=1 Tax=Hypothenemus hampei TaxID=57062 RepID=A0ABD1EEK6_HYPHA
MFNIGNSSISVSASGYKSNTHLIEATKVDEVTAQLPTKGLTKVPTTKATVSSKKQKKINLFQTRPLNRQQEQTRLLRKLKKTIEDYVMITGKQAIALVTAPGNPNMNYKVFGAQPLQHVINNLKHSIVEKLETATILQESKFLVANPLTKLAQPRFCLIPPHVLKYSNKGRKPEEGQESTRPPRWPQELPWENRKTNFQSEHKEAQESSVCNSLEIKPTQESIMDHSLSNVTKEKSPDEFRREPLSHNSTNFITSTPPAESTKSYNQPKNSRKKRPHDDATLVNELQRLENMSNILNTGPQQAHAEDEFYCFAMSVAAQLRKLPLPVAIDTQNKIQNIISTARLQYHSSLHM